MAKLNAKQNVFRLQGMITGFCDYGMIDADFDDAANDNPPTHESLDHVQPNYRVLESITG